jgi:hypothetical protein
LRFAAGDLCGMDERGDAVPGDHITHEHRRVEQGGIDPERVAVLDAHRACVAHQNTNGRI